MMDGTGAVIGGGELKTIVRVVKSHCLFPQLCVTLSLKMHGF